MNCLLMREISVRNTVRMWDTYLVRSFLFSNIIFNLLVGGRTRRIFSISPLCLLGVFSPVEQKVEANGLPGTLHCACPFIFWQLSAGDHYVSAITANARVDGSRDWDASQRGICPLFDMAQRTKPFRKVKHALTYVTEGLSATCIIAIYQDISVVYKAG